MLDPETARIAILSGCAVRREPSAESGHSAALQSLPNPAHAGNGTVKEIIEAMEAGAEIIKIFPSEGLGPWFCEGRAQPIAAGATDADRRRESR